MSVQVPAACTLPTVEQPLRQEEFATLCRTALRSQERLGDRQLRLTLAGGSDLAETVRDLARRETECCSFFDFTITSTSGVVVLDIEVPAGHSSVLDGLSDLATLAESTGSKGVTFIRPP